MGSINPVFNIFRATDSWPSLCEYQQHPGYVLLIQAAGSILGYPQTIQDFVYFNRYVLALSMCASEIYALSSTDVCDTQAYTLGCFLSLYLSGPRCNSCSAHQLDSLHIR